MVKSTLSFVTYSRRWHAETWRAPICRCTMNRGCNPWATQLAKTTLILNMYVREQPAVNRIHGRAVFFERTGPDFAVWCIGYVNTMVAQAFLKSVGIVAVIPGGRVAPPSSAHLPHFAKLPLLPLLLHSRSMSRDYFRLQGHLTWLFKKSFFQ